MLRASLRLLALGSVLAATSAHAAPFTVRYAITGGTSSGTLFVGAVTSGSVTMRAESITVSNRTSEAILLTLELYGTAGSTVSGPLLADLNGIEGSLFRGLLKTVHASFFGFDHIMTLSASSLGEITVGVIRAATVGVGQITFTGQEVEAVPEPGSLALLLVAIGGLASALRGWSRRRRYGASSRSTAGPSQPLATRCVAPRRRATP